MVEEQDGKRTSELEIGLAYHEPNEEQQDDEASFRKSVEVLLLCPVCHETVTDPRQLDCGHFFCSECVELLTVDDAVRCAKCSTSTPITAYGVKVHELALSLVTLLTQHGPHMIHKEPDVIDNASAVYQRLNGLSEHEDSDEEEPDFQDYAGPTRGGDDEDLLDAAEYIEPAVNGTNEPEVIQNDSEETERVDEPTDMILEPPQDYQSPEEEEEDSDEPLPSPPVEPVEPVADETEVHETPREPVEHDATETVQKMESTSESAVVEDEMDSKMKASEMKPSNVAINIEMERQCGDCHSNKCTCNCNSTLLTPPVSNGSQLSVETNTSSIHSDEGELEIVVKQLSRFVVPEAASHVEVAHSNKIYVTRWTYDEDGAVCTFDRQGNKMKFIHSGHHNFTGITLSKLGFLFALNTSKHRIEEYSGVNGKKVKQFKLDLCRDAHAVDIMPTGEILVIDQERNSVIVYPNSKKINVKPRSIKHDLIKEPYDIATGPDGFYITCAATKCLVKMDLEGNVIWSYGHSDETKKKFKVPQGVCVDDAGQIYVVDRGNHSIFVLTKDGELKGHLTDKENPGQMKSPWYISVRDGILAVLFSHNVIKTYQFA